MVDEYTYVKPIRITPQSLIGFYYACYNYYLIKIYQPSSNLSTNIVQLGPSGV